eukprot:scaffold218656_cov30-Prasinocladus_malaysianus.AAC.1
MSCIALGLLVFHFALQPPTSAWQPWGFYQPEYVASEGPNEELDSATERVEVSASEAVEAVVNSALEFVNSKCSAPEALGDRPMFTASWVAQKPRYVRIPGKKRGKYRPRNADEPRPEPTEAELERQ